MGDARETIRYEHASINASYVFEVRVESDRFAFHCFVNFWWIAGFAGEQEAQMRKLSHIFPDMKVPTSVSQSMKHNNNWKPALKEYVH